MWLSVPLRHFCAVPGCLDSTKPPKKAVFVAGKYYKIMNLLQLSKICTKFDINLGAFLNRFFPGEIVPREGTKYFAIFLKRKIFDFFRKNLW